MIEPKKFGVLDGFVLRINLVECWLEPRIVDVADVRIAFVSVRKGFFGGSFTRGDPFALPTQAFAAFLAHGQRIVPIDHDRRMCAGAIGIFVTVNAITLAAQVREALLRIRGEFVADDNVIGGVVRLTETVEVDFGAIGRVHVSHVVGTRGGRCRQIGYVC